MLPGDFQAPRRPTGRRLILFGALGLGGVAGLVIVVAIATFVISAWLGLPLDAFGVNDGPDQPIAFPHPTHVEDLGLDCTFCHRNVTEGAAATIPAVGLCMSCHLTVGDDKPEVEKLRNFHTSGIPVNWVRVHRVPDHVNFVHEPHIRHFSEQYGGPSGTCQVCHGDVGSMVKVRQVRSLKMGDCVNCHRDNEAPTDCTTCHY